jgi:hypothetical protein
LLNAFIQDYSQCVTTKHAAAEDAAQRFSRRISDALFALEEISAIDTTRAERVRMLGVVRKQDLDEIASTNDRSKVVRERLTPANTTAAAALFEPLDAMGTQFAADIARAGAKACLQVGRQGLPNATLADITATRAMYNAFKQYLRGQAREDIAMQQVMTTVYHALGRSLGAAPPPAVTNSSCSRPKPTSPDSTGTAPSTTRTAPDATGTAPDSTRTT